MNARLATRVSRMGEDVDEVMKVAVASKLAIKVVDSIVVVKSGLRKGETAQSTEIRRRSDLGQCP